MSRILVDEADWSGIQMTSKDVGYAHKRELLHFNGYQYCTMGERWIAEILTMQYLPFTPDVEFSIPLPGDKERHFVPDFVFNGTVYLWKRRGVRELVHGIEVKGKSPNGNFSDRALENVRLLFAWRKINIKLVSNNQAKTYWIRGHLPLFPFP
jgi:hypothetical protein